MHVEVRLHLHVLLEQRLNGGLCSISREEGVQLHTGEGDATGCTTHMLSLSRGTSQYTYVQVCDPT